MDHELLLWNESESTEIVGEKHWLESFIAACFFFFSCLPIFNLETEMNSLMGPSSLHWSVCEPLNLSESGKTLCYWRFSLCYELSLCWIILFLLKMNCLLGNLLLTLCISLTFDVNFRCTSTCCISDKLLFSLLGILLWLRIVWFVWCMRAESHANCLYSDIMHYGWERVKLI